MAGRARCGPGVRADGGASFAGVRDQLDVILVVPWYGGSHRAWADGLASASRHRIRLVTHRDRFWRWRFQGGPVTLAADLTAEITTGGRPDCIVVSSLTDVASLVGIARRELAGIPVGIYLHEAQGAYPRTSGARRPAMEEPAVLAEWRSLCAADVVWVSSPFLRESLGSSLRMVLDRVESPTHLHLLDRVMERVRVLPPGVDLSWAGGTPEPGGAGPPLVLWNQRWDPDKAPMRVVNALAHVAARGVDFRVALVGEVPEHSRTVFETARRKLGPRVEIAGHLERSAYLELLGHADIVVSAARHEFFGIAPVEAMAAGCVPLYPDRENYPNLIPERYRPHCLHHDHDLVPRLTELLTDLARWRNSTSGLAGEMQRFDWARVVGSYDRELARLARYGHAGGEERGPM